MKGPSPCSVLTKLDTDSAPTRELCIPVDIAVVAISTGGVHMYDSQIACVVSVSA